MRTSVAVFLCLLMLGGLLGYAAAQDVVKVGHLGITADAPVYIALEKGYFKERKIELQLEPVSFPSLLEDLFVTVRPMADEQGTPIDLEHTGAPATIVSDPRRVRQILLNLLSNAIKFGRGKPIRVLSTATDERGVVIEVIDEGVGIHEEDQGKIFDEFVQLARSDRQEGTGLGLPISQRLAVILSGSLTVQSVPDVGSTFKLTLPRLADPVAAIEEEDRNEQPSEEAAEAPDEQRAESAA